MLTRFLRTPALILPHRFFLPVVGLLSVCLLNVTSSWSLAASPGSQAKPNVLFIICDDLNCDLGCYGNEVVQSPNIDALASRGVKFDRAYCQYPLCGPSRASFMTGQYPDQNGVLKNAVYLRSRSPKVITMSQAFRRAGYDAMRIGKIFHYNVPMDIGKPGHDDPTSWDRTINPRGHDREIHDKIFTLRKGRFGATLSWYADDTTDEEQTDGVAATEADRALEQYAETKQPFFLAVGLYRPHTPYVAPEAYFEMYPPEEVIVPSVPKGYFQTIPKVAAATVQAKKEQNELAPELAQQAIAAYHASITFADAQVGRILESLDRHGLRDNTVVVFTSDHGYHMGEHGHYQKRSLFENATRVPMIMAGPSIREGQDSASLAEMIDLYPTLCCMTGVETPPGRSGVDLSPTLADPTTVVRTDALSKLFNGYSLRTNKYRITLWGDGGIDGVELYDVRRDPTEMKNLANDPAYAKVIAELKPRIESRIAASQ